MALPFKIYFSLLFYICSTPLPHYILYATVAQKYPPKNILISKVGIYALI